MLNRDIRLQSLRSHRKIRSSTRITTLFQLTTTSLRYSIILRSLYCSNTGHWLPLLSCFISQMRYHTTHTTLLQYKSQKNNFPGISGWKMKSLTTLATLLYLTTIKMKSLATLTTLLYLTTIKMKSLATLTTLLYLTTIKMKSLATLTTLFYFTTIKMKYLSTLTTLFKFTTIKMKFLTMFATLFYFTTINPRDHTTFTTLPLSIKYYSSQEFQCFHKIYVPQ